MNINKEIVDLLRRGSDIPTVIIYSKTRAVMLMPTKKEDENGRHYKIWNDLSSLSDAICIASEFGNWASGVEFHWQEFSQIPENPNPILFAMFFNELADKKQ